MLLSTDRYMQTSLYQELHVILHVQSIVEKVTNIHSLLYNVTVLSFLYFLLLGYLVSSLFLSEDHELIVLLINTLQKVCVILNLKCSVLRTFCVWVEYSNQPKKKLEAKGCMLEKTSKK